MSFSSAPTSVLLDGHAAADNHQENQPEPNLNNPTYAKITASAHQPSFQAQSSTSRLSSIQQNIPSDILTSKYGSYLPPHLLPLFASERLSAERAELCAERTEPERLIVSDSHNISDHPHHPSGRRSGGSNNNTSDQSDQQEQGASSARQHPSTNNTAYPSRRLDDQNKNNNNQAYDSYVPDRRFAVVLENCHQLTQETCLRAVADIIGGRNIHFCTKLSGGRICLYLTDQCCVDKICEEGGINIGLDFITTRKYISDSRKIIISNCPPELTDHELAALIKPYGKITSAFTKLRFATKYEDLQHIKTWRRSVYMSIPDDSPALPSQIQITNRDGNKQMLYLTLDEKSCSFCKAPGHIQEECKKKKHHLQNFPPLSNASVNQRLGANQPALPRAAATPTTSAQPPSTLPPSPQQQALVGHPGVSDTASPRSSTLPPPPPPPSQLSKPPPPPPQQQNKLPPTQGTHHHTTKATPPLLQKPPQDSTKSNHELPENTQKQNSKKQNQQTSSSLTPSDKALDTAEISQISLPPPLLSQPAESQQCKKRGLSPELPEHHSTTSWIVSAVSQENSHKKINTSTPQQSAFKLRPYHKHQKPPP